MSDIVWHYLPEYPESCRDVYAAIATPRSDGLEIGVCLATFWRIDTEHRPAFVELTSDSYLEPEVFDNVYAWAEIVVPPAPPVERP